MIDCDVHCAPESWATLEPYLDSSWRQFIELGDMRLGPLFEDSYPTPAPTSAVAEARANGGPVVPSRYEVLRERLLDSEDRGQVILNCLTMFDAPRNPYLQAALASAVNDWLRAEWLDRDPRLRASIVIPYANPEAAVAEIARVAEDDRFVQVLLPIRADALWGQRPYNAVHEAAAGHGLVIGLHAWGLNGRAPTPTGRTATYLEDYLLNPIIVQQHVVSFVAEGAFARLPELRVVVLECGFTWLPPLLWRMDKHWKTFWAEVPWVRELPSEYVRRQLAATIAPAGLGDAAPEHVHECVDMVGIASLLYASDYPHDHGPSAQRLIDLLGEESRDAVLTGNASRFYGRG